MGHFPFTHVEFIDDGSIANEDLAESGSWGMKNFIDNLWLVIVYVVNEKYL